jgi:hypothetical protein
MLFFNGNRARTRLYDDNDGLARPVHLAIVMGTMAALRLQSRITVVSKFHWLHWMIVAPFPRDNTSNEWETMPIFIVSATILSFWGINFQFNHWRDALSS